MEVLNNIAKSVDTYINALTQLGYKKQGDVDKLLIYNFIGEMLTGDMRFYIDEKDYKAIEKALYCLYGSSCLIPYPKYVNYDNLFGRQDDGYGTLPRFTEDNTLRFTQTIRIRFEE